MKRILAFLLIFSFITVAPYPQSGRAETSASLGAAISASAEQSEVNFSGLSDPALLRYVEDCVYATLVEKLDSDSFFVENVSAIYISKEYLDELAYNSQANIYFGYTLRLSHPSWNLKKRESASSDLKTLIMRIPV